MSAKRPWTPEEDEVVRAGFGKRPTAELAAELDRTEIAVRARAWHTHGLRLRLAPAPRAKRTWTPEEDDAIRETYGTVKTRALARRLGRSETAIQVRKKRLGVAARDNIWTSHEVARLFDVDSHLVVRWIKAGKLKARKAPLAFGAHRMWAIDPEGVEDFIRDEPEAYNWRRMERGYHRTLAEAVWRADPLLTVGEVARRHGVSGNCITKAIRAGRLEARRGHGPNAPWYIRTSAAATFRPCRPELVGRRGKGKKRRRAA